MPEHEAEKAYTPCAACGRRMPPESDAHAVVFCSPVCYGRDVQARGIVHIYPTAQLDRSLSNPPGQSPSGGDA